MTINMDVIGFAVEPSRLTTLRKLTEGWKLTTLIQSLEHYDKSRHGLDRINLKRWKISSSAAEQAETAIILDYFSGF
jgi:hypothetical protein